MAIEIEGQQMSYSEAYRLDRDDARTHDAVVAMCERKNIEYARFARFLHNQAIIEEMTVDFTDRQQKDFK